MSDSEFETYQPASVIEHKTSSREPTSVLLGKRKPRSTPTTSAHARSDSEFETCQSSSVIEHKTNNRKPTTVRLRKRKPHSTSTNSTRASKKSCSNDDIFNIGSKHRRESEAEYNATTSRLSSFIVNRVANGNERRTTNTSGDYYIDCKVYRSEDVHLTDSSELWKKALVRLKLQTDVDSTQWRKLQQFIMSADTLFVDLPTFYDK